RRGPTVPRGPAAHVGLPFLADREGALPATRLGARPDLPGGPAHAAGPRLLAGVPRPLVRLRPRRGGPQPCRRVPRRAALRHLDGGAGRHRLATLVPVLAGTARRAATAAQLGPAGAAALQHLDRRTDHRRHRSGGRCPRALPDLGELPRPAPAVSGAGAVRVDV